jgi:uncharacterized protein (DUF2147 family)
MAAVLPALVWPTFSVDSLAASPIEGTWRTQNLVLEIFDCEELVCGRIAWLGDPVRRLSQCGKTIVWGLRPTGASEWTGGAILDPNDGVKYDLSASFQPDGTIHARIYSGIELIGTTKILRRIPLRSLAGWC